MKQRGRSLQTHRGDRPFVPSICNVLEYCKAFNEIADDAGKNTESLTSPGLLVFIMSAKSVKAANV